MSISVDKYSLDYGALSLYLESRKKQFKSGNHACAKNLEKFITVERKQFK